MSLNGMSLNGMCINGMCLNGMSINGMSINGMSLNGMCINGSQLGRREVGRAAALRHRPRRRQDERHPVERRHPAPPHRLGEHAARPNNDVWAYGVSYALAGGAWAPLCGTGGHAARCRWRGTWNYGSGVTGGGSWTASATYFTFGCRGTALAKCVELGYKPWKTVGGVSLRDHHQACTRMIRADYCGDGKAWT